MVFLAVITGLIILFLIIQCVHLNSEGEIDGFSICCGCILGMMLIFELILINESISESYPTAMDVYRGKTILEYTIRDREIIDSVVIFKENYGND